MHDPIRRRALLALALSYSAALVAALAAGWLCRGLHPVLVAAIADVVATAVVFAFSVHYDNSSIYDPYWSVAPVPIALYWTLSASAGPSLSLRQALVLTLVGAWAVRLTANCLTRWGGLADEDFRYVELRGRGGRRYWPLSFVGIHLAPTVWVFLGLLPLFPVLHGVDAGRSPGVLDLIVFAVAVLVTAIAIAIEAIADQQLRAFLRTRRDGRAVLSDGLWAWSRHPNYFGEVLFWWGLYLFGVAADSTWAWSAVGPVSITLLFLCISVPWMDRRMLARHPEWAERLRATSALVPLPSRRIATATNVDPARGRP